MALNLEAVGKPIGPVEKSYTWKDVVLYSLGVGSGFSELDYCYEKRLKVLPSFSIAAIFDFLAHIGATSNVNLAGILHGEQSLVFHNPIPPEGTLSTTGRIVKYYDKGPGKGALVIGESDTYHSNGKKLFTSVITIFARLDGGFGGENAPKKEFVFPDRDPDIVVDDSPGVNQPLLYRLSGDIFDLHVDPEFAKMAGFEKPIMHGLCTHGFACRALVNSLIPGMPEKARRMDCRFSKTLYPGTPIRTLIWKTGEGKALWKTLNAVTGDVVIDHGVFEYGDPIRERLDFSGQVAVVTGAGAGLGRVYALELAKRGAKVVVNDLGAARDGTGEASSTAADRVVEEIRAAGGQAVADYNNVATREGGEAIIRTALDAFGTVDILINNAGILRDKSMVKMEPETWKAVIDVHLNGAYHVTRPAFKVMKEKGYGRIVMTTSAAGLYGNFGQTNYASAKMGLVGFMNTLKIEGEKYGIRVNTVALLAASRLTEDVTPPEIFVRMKPEYVAPIVLVLCSKQCPVNGRIYNAGMGFYNRAAIWTGAGVVLGKGNVPSVEEIRDRMQAIASLKGAKVYDQLNEQVADVYAAVLNPKEVVDAGTEEQGGSKFTAASAVFEAMPGAFRADAAKGIDVVFQYRISGDGGGDWFCAVKDGQCQVTAGLHEKSTCTLLMASSDFLDMMNGKLSPMQAYTGGKLRIEGEIMKSQLIEKLFRIDGR
uniref:SDR family NAD(P)-dependent oxidoreductase n=1 Tax=Desulfatirhabdium butyrativorans TaxID=340467 RepID=A0A7C4W1B3_9BACT